MRFFKTPAAALELDTTSSRLNSLLRSKKLTPPAKDTSGDYVWTDADLEAARQALRIDRRKKAD